MSVMINTATTLAGLGFAASSWGYMKGAWQLQCSRGWWCLSRPWPEGKQPFGEAGPGLWKWVKGREVFEWPEDGWDLDGDEPMEEAWAAMLGWAWATAEGQLPQGWQAPARSEVDGWLAGADLAIGRGHASRQVELRTEDELAMEVPVLHPRPEGVAEERQRWLRRMALEVQARWPLIRLREETNGGWAAEVNATGAPPVAVRGLILTGLASLRGAVSGLVEGAEVLADATVVSEALTFSMGQTEIGENTHETNQHQA